MKKMYPSAFIATIALLMACGSNSNEAIDPATQVEANGMDSTMHSKYEVSMVNNKKDPSCGMPVTAGISDTAHYQNKVLGFCSSECKQAFLENPAANLAAAEIK